MAQATRLSLQSRYAARTEDQQKAWFLAASAVQTFSKVLSEDDPAWDGWKEPWAKGPAQAVTLGPGSFLYTVRDEQALLPLNSLPADFLLRLPGFTPESSQALPAQRAEGKLLHHLGELRALAGYNAEALEELVPLATVHGGAPVNLNTAGRPVLEKLQFSEALLQAIDRFRMGADAVVGTQDDGVFERADLEEISSKLLQGTGYLLTPEDAAFLNGLLQEPRLLGVTSGWFRVQAEGQAARSGARVRVEAVVDRSGTLGGWHED